MVKNQFVELMRLALDKCSYEIHKVIQLYIGMWVGFAVWAIFTVRNFILFEGQTAPNVFFPGIESSQFGILFTSMVIGIYNVIACVTLIAIVVILFEYAATFTYICYCYDNCSWETPKQISRFFSWISSKIDETAERSRKETHSNRINIINEINKIKNKE